MTITEKLLMEQNSLLEEQNRLIKEQNTLLKNNFYSNNDINNVNKDLNSKSFIHKFKYILLRLWKCESKNNGEYTSLWLTLFIEAFFGAMQMIYATSFLGFLLILILTIEQLSLIKIIVLVLLIFICAFLFVISRGARKEVSREEDKNYLATLFSGILCFLTVILSIIMFFFSKEQFLEWLNIK